MTMYNIWIYLLNMSTYPTCIIGDPLRRKY